MAWFRRLIVLRRSSVKSEGAQASPDLSSCGRSRRSFSEKSSVKSILGSSSFCCASGQQEDAVADSKPSSRPVKKKSSARKCSSDSKSSVPYGDVTRSRAKNELCDGQAASTEDAKRKILSSEASPKKSSQKKRPPALRRSAGKELTDVIWTLQKDPANFTQNNLASSTGNATSKLYSKADNVIKTTENAVKKDNVPVPVVGDLGISVTGDGFRSDDTDNLDCPCCDGEASYKSNQDSDRLERKDLAIGGDSQEANLELVVEALQKELKAERMKLKLQLNLAQDLQTETQKKMELLQQELTKEKDARREVEEKLLNDCNNVCVNTGASKFIQAIATSGKETSVKCQILLSKLDQLESEKNQQKLDYDSCLEEVANKLVHTLFVQKDIEEENRALRLRIEQLETENSQLLQRIDCLRQSKSGNSTAASLLTNENMVPLLQNNVKVTADPHCLQTFSNADAYRSFPYHSKFPVQQETESHGFSSNLESNTIPTNFLYPPSKLKSPNSNSNNNFFSAAEIKLHTNGFSMPNRLKSDIALQRASNSTFVEMSTSKTKQNFESQRLCHTVFEEQDMTRGDVSSRSSSELFRVNNDDELRLKDIWCSPTKDSKEDIPEGTLVNSHLPEREALDQGELKFLQEDSGDCSSTVGTQRTKDEGYSTMSSDQQQDSTADTIVSEPSLTFRRINSKNLRLFSDDSVTDCVDGSMTSSSDSGFGPLQQIAISCQSNSLTTNSPCTNVTSLKNRDTNTVVSSVTTYLKDYSPGGNPSEVFQPSCHFDTDGAYEEPCLIGALSSSSSKQSRDYCTIRLSSTQSDLANELPNHSTQCINETDTSSKIIVSDSTSTDLRTLFAKPASVETAEKATSTDLEEVEWREKALAHFIDESIWSLYSSESDTQFRFISSELEKETSPSNSENPKPTRDLPSFYINPPHQTVRRHAMTNSEELLLLNNVLWFSGRQRNLERASSDSLLYLKDAVHELEDSLKPGLKTSRNFTAKHIPSYQRFSLSNILCEEPPPLEAKINTCPEILLNLEKAMKQNNFSSVPLSASSSLCSLPSSSSCLTLSEGGDDPELLRHQSRKGSQRGKSSCGQSNSLFFRKDERRNTTKIPFANGGERNRLPDPSSTYLFTSDLPILFPDCGPPKNATLVSPPMFPIIFTCENLDDDEQQPCPNLEEIGLDLQLLDNEVKEFNGDFYRLCDIGSNLSIDQSQPNQNMLLLGEDNHVATTKFIKPARPVSLPFYDVPKSYYKNFGFRHCKTESSVVKNRHSGNPPPVSRGFLRKPTTKLSTQTECSYKCQPSLPKSPTMSNRRLCNDSSKQAPIKVGACTSPKKRILVPMVTSPKSSPSKDRSCWKKRSKRTSRNEKVTNKEGCGTAWIHLQTDSNMSDPKTLASLLDSMADTVSSSGTSSEDEDRDLPVIQSNSHLHQICKEKRKRLKASRADGLVAISSRHRLSVLNRNSLYYRFGDREKEAIACFDFLEEIPTSSSEHDVEMVNKRLTPPRELDTVQRGRDYPQASRNNGTTAVRSYRLKVPVLWNQPLSHNMSSSTLNSQDYELLDHVSLSDSCAESYASTPDSFEEGT